MQKWTVKQDDTLWLVLHNGEEVSRSNSEAGAWANAWRRANTSARRRGVESPAVIGDEIVVAGGTLTSAQKEFAKRQRHKAAALKAGFETIDKMVAAINDPNVKRVVLE